MLCVSPLYKEMKLFVNVSLKFYFYFEEKLFIIELVYYLYKRYLVCTCQSLSFQTLTLS